MGPWISILGILTAVFFLLASFNGLKRYVKAPIVKAIAKQHRLFGMLATLTALVHMFMAVSAGELRITGTLALIGVVITGMLGMAFYQSKNKSLYLAHRLAGPITFVLIIIHIIFNASV